MKTQTLARNLRTTFGLSLLAAVTIGGITNSLSAAGGKPAVSTSTSTSTSTVRGGGGGGGKSNVPKPPGVPLASGTFTMTATSSYGGSSSGSYQVLPYYPSLSWLNVNVSVSSLNLPDGTVVYASARTTSGIYGVASGAAILAAGSGSMAISTFCSPSDLVTGVTVTLANGTVVYNGQ